VAKLQEEWRRFCKVEKPPERMGTVYLEWAILARLGREHKRE